MRKYVQFVPQVNSNYPEGQRRVLEMMSFDARKAVERYIQRNGPEAFERVVKAVSIPSEAQMNTIYKHSIEGTRVQSAIHF